MKQKLHIASLFLFLFIGLLVKDNLHFFNDSLKSETALLKEDTDADDSTDDESNDQEEDNDDDYDHSGPDVFENVIITNFSKSHFTDRNMVSDTQLSDLFSPPEF